MSGRKVLWQTKLTELATSDVDGLGKLREDDMGNLYRFVKNVSATALIAGAPALQDLGYSSPSDVNRRVWSPDAATGPSTALVSVPAGAAMTAIACSGSSTGAYGWIMVQGYRKVSVMQSATAVDQQPGCRAVGTSSQPATMPWGKCATSTIDSTNGGVVTLRGIEIAAAVASTGVATAASALVRVCCMP